MDKIRRVSALCVAHVSKRMQGCVSTTYNDPAHCLVDTLTASHGPHMVEQKCEKLVELAGCREMTAVCWNCTGGFE